MIDRLRSRIASRRDDILGAAILFVLVNLTFAPFLWGDLSIRDSVTISSLYATGSRQPMAVEQPVYREVDAGAPAWQTEPWFALEHELAARERTAPIWNPYSAFGTPLAANMQSQPYSPFAWVAVASNGPRAYNVFVAVRVYAAGLLAFLFLRLFVSLWPAAVGGAAFMYTGYFWTFVTMPEMSVEVCIPGLLFGVELLLRRQTAARVATFASFFGLAVFGGMPESLALALTLTYVYAAVRLVGDPTLRGRARTSVPALAGASALGFGVAAVQLLPFLEYLPLSRNDHSGTFNGLNVDPFTRATAAMYLAPLSQGPPWNDIFRGFAGFTEVRGFFGCATAFFALVASVNRIGDALMRRRATRPVAFFSAVALFCIAKRFGEPAVNWVGALPVLRLVNFPKYEEAILACAVAALAAFGVAAVVERRVSGFQSAAAAALPLIVLTAAAGSHRTAYAAVEAYRWYYENGLLFALTCLLAAFAVAIVARRTSLPPLAFGLAAVVLVAGEPNASYIVPMFYVIDREPSQGVDTLRGAPYVDFLRERTRDGYRFLGRDLLLFPNWSAAFGIRDVRAIDALYDRHYLPFVNAFLPPGYDGELVDRFLGYGPTDLGSVEAQRFLQLSSVRYVGTAVPIDLGGPVSRAFQDHRLAVAAALYVGTFAIGSERRGGVFMSPPASDLAIPAEIPTDAKTMRFAIGMLPAVWKPPVCADGVRYSIAVRDGARTDRLWERYIDPKHNASERRWLPQTVPIARYRGRKVDILMSTAAGPSGSTCMDWSVWSELRFTGGAHDRPQKNPYRPIFKSDKVTISQYAHPLPRLAIYRHVVTVSDEAAALELLPSSAFDPNAEAIVQADDSPVDLATLRRSRRSPVLGGTLTADGSRYVSATVATPAAALAVLDDTYYPGWTARLDGRVVPILRANYLFRGVVVPPGAHVLSFTYEPRSFDIGRDVSLASVCSVIGLFGWSAARRRPVAA